MHTQLVSLPPSGLGILGIAPPLKITIFRASKLKDHKIGRSPYFYETKSGDFSRELFKALPKTIGPRPITQ